MGDLLMRLEVKKGLLAAQPPRARRWDYQRDLELTYTSNAIDGNRLSLWETMQVIETESAFNFIPLRDHLEAFDVYEAIQFVRDLARRDGPVTEKDLLDLHREVRKRSSPDGAGHYAVRARFVRTDTGRHLFPAPGEIANMMAEFSAWLAGAAPTPDVAFMAHSRLMKIHPFQDGNGRVARLLMNLLLLRGGYPTVAVRPEDREEYMSGIQQEQAGQGSEVLDGLLYRRLDETLQQYLAVRS